MRVCRVNSIDRKSSSQTCKYANSTNNNVSKRRYATQRKLHCKTILEQWDRLKENNRITYEFLKSLCPHVLLSRIILVYRSSPIERKFTFFYSYSFCRSMRWLIGVVKYIVIVPFLCIFHHIFIIHRIRILLLYFFHCLWNVRVNIQYLIVCIYFSCVYF